MVEDVISYHKGHFQKRAKSDYSNASPWIRIASQSYYIYPPGYIDASLGDCPMNDGTNGGTGGVDAAEVSLYAFDV